MEKATAKKLNHVMKKAPAAPNHDKVTKTAQQSRVGKSPVIAYMNRDAIKQLKYLCIEQEITQQDAIIAALNDYFIKHGKPGVAG